MKGKRLIVVSMLGFVGAMAGCEQKAPSTGGAATEQAAVSAPAAPAPREVPAELVSENRMLTLKPGAIDLCKDPAGIIAMHVSWDASSTGTEGVDVFLQAPNEEKKLWARSGATGGDQTGVWMREGSVVTLVNGQDNSVLASLEVKSIPCN